MISIHVIAPFVILKLHVLGSVKINSVCSKGDLNVLVYKFLIHSIASSQPLQHQMKFFAGDMFISQMKLEAETFPISFLRFHNSLKTFKNIN